MVYAEAALTAAQILLLPQQFALVPPCNLTCAAAGECSNQNITVPIATTEVLSTQSLYWHVTTCAFSESDHYVAL